MMRVYHASVGTFGQSSVCPMPNWPDDYEFVAKVDGDLLEDAFVLTNHIEKSWTENDGVEEIGPGPHRSTSVGDVVVNSQGAFLCRGNGWQEISKEGEGLAVHS